MTSHKAKVIGQKSGVASRQNFNSPALNGLLLTFDSGLLTFSAGGAF
jgi:hypothetical protein